MDLEPATTPRENRPPEMEIPSRLWSFVLTVLVFVALAGGILERAAWNTNIELLSWGLMLGGGLPAMMIWKLAARPVNKSARDNDA
jgi:hypothetical protein